MVEDLHRLLGEIADPEIPVLSIGDLGLIREITQSYTGAVTVKITPTYSGCPAMDEIKEQIYAVLRAHGVSRVKVETVLSPPWTTDWMPEAARERLREYGIAPPGRLINIEAAVACPRCGSLATQMVSRFGSTACKAHYKCRTCLEPFDAFKRH